MIILIVIRNMKQFMGTYKIKDPTEQKFDEKWGCIVIIILQVY